jgi:hypothetical protein
MIMNNVNQPVPNPEMPNNLPPLPESPQDAGMSEEEMRADLDNMFNKVEAKERDFRSRSFMNANKLNEVKTKMIRMFFDLMQQMGVDPSNVDSIGAFLRQLEQQDPDLYTIFEAAFNGMMGNGGQPAGEENPGLMNKFSNLAESVLRK